MDSAAATLASDHLVTVKRLPLRSGVLEVEVSNIASLLIVEDDKDVLEAARFSLHGHFHRIESRQDLAGVAAAMAERPFDVALVDMNFTPASRDGAEGLEALRLIRMHDPHMAVVMMTAFGSVGLAVAALKEGAADFVLKPWKSQNLIDVMQQAASVTARRRRENENFDLEDLERAAIVRALAHCGGSIPRAAQALGLTRPTLYRRIARYAL